jgi:adenylylsulfate kinase
MSDIQWFVKREEYDLRLNICKSCEHYRSLLGQCGVCGCFMRMKGAFAQQKCPIDKWSVSSTKHAKRPNKEEKKHHLKSNNDIIPIKILIMGLPGSGKTTLAHSLKQVLEDNGLNVIHFNADAVRKEHNDWDFSEDGRLRQAQRMRILGNNCRTQYAICDFVAPTEVTRDLFEPEIIIWMDTINESIYDDTNKLFQIPTKYDIQVTEKDSEKWAQIIMNYMIENWNKYE